MLESCSRLKAANSLQNEQICMPSENTISVSIYAALRGSTVQPFQPVQPLKNPSRNIWIIVSMLALFCIFRVCRNVYAASSFYAK